MSEAAVQFVMRASTVEYLTPARFDDLLEILIRTVRIGRTSVTQELAAYRAPDGTLMCRADQTLMLIDVATHTAVPIGDDFRRVVADFEGIGMEAER